MAVVVRMALAVALGVAAVSKLRSPRATAAGLATFGVAGPLRSSVTVALATLEALLAAFAAAVATALARGAGGAPCGCFGARSRVSAVSVGRNVALAAAFAVVPSLPSGAPTTEGWLAIAIGVAFICIAGLTVAVLALAREVGVLRLRLGAESALDVSDEGPPLGSHVDLRERFPEAARAPLALAVFSSDGCRLCQSLKPVVAAFTRDRHVAVEVFDEVRDAEVWRKLKIPGSPFAVALDRHGAVRAKGTFNTYGQLESILAAAERGLADAYA